MDLVGSMGLGAMNVENQVPQRLQSLVKFICSHRGKSGKVVPLESDIVYSVGKACKVHDADMKTERVVRKKDQS